MISLDKKILDPNSVVARRMIEYGKENELFIVIPSKEKKSFDLSDTVHVQSTGGVTKVGQLFSLYYLGKNIIHNSRLPKPGTGGQAKFIIQDSLITTQDPFFTGLIGWLLKRKFKIKLEVQVHGDFFGGYYHGLKLCLAKFVLKRADKIRVVGERIKQNLTKLNPAPFWCGVNKIDESKIIVRPIAVDVEKIKNYQPKRDLHKCFPEAEKIFVAMGRLDPVKNIPWLVGVFADVVKRRPRYLLLIFGSGTDESVVRLQVIGYKLQGNNIRLEPWTTDQISYLKTADCLLFSSLSEGYGLVPMEAYAAGCPVIMNDVGVANYELKPSERVKILPINDKEKWIEAILSI